MVFISAIIQILFIVGLVIAYHTMVAVPYFLSGINTKGIKSPALMIFIEALKIVASILLVHFMFKGLFGYDTYSVSEGYYWINYAVAFFAIIGEVLPVSRRFRGNSGALIALFAVLAANPITGAIACGVFGVMYLVTRQRAQSIIASAVCYPVIVLIYEALIAKNTAWLPCFAIATAICAVLAIKNRKQLVKTVKA